MSSPHNVSSWSWEQDEKEHYCMSKVSWGKNNLFMLPRSKSALKIINLVTVTWQVWIVCLYFFNIFIRGNYLNLSLNLSNGCLMRLSSWDCCMLDLSHNSRSVNLSCLGILLTTQMLNVTHKHTVSRTAFVSAKTASLKLLRSTFCVRPQNLILKSLVAQINLMVINSE